MSDVKKVKPLNTVVIDFETFTDPEFVPPGSYYIRDASGDYIFIKTSDRKLAQKWSDDNYGRGKYNVVPAKAPKTVSRLESGGYSVTGTATRKVKR